MTSIVSSAKFVVYNAHKQAVYPLTDERLLKIVAVSSDECFAEVEGGISIEHDHRGFHFDQDNNACAEVQVIRSYRDPSGIPHTDNSVVGYVRL